ncbi:Eisosome component PIL1-domain-containing protein [Fimicolochytrium jonesii]|uniref:Eisosome component PIL1-domain-containing protein n=1 Tax=Fimicolochytrium jonesii TaxID=1396493 RepID=UPI0022FEC91C|nr:Eisosome component PIL1-domain-containing protein [Fimicolochytrium jonesii]KAI8820652.1 Eisosome component PIL1-domain-containing protein [Fimicolochytrium jonesii]
MAAFQGLRRSVVSLNSHDHAELSILIKEEKDVATELHKFAKEKLEAGKYLHTYGKTQHKDIEDISEKYLTLIEKFVDFHSTTIEKYESYRSRLKDMRQREETLYALRKRHKELQDKYKDAVKKQKPHETLKIELGVVEKDLAEQEAECEGYKRATLKEALHTQMDAWMDLGNKMAIFATYGKHLADQIPQGSLAPGQELPPYEGSGVTARITVDFTKALRAYEAEAKAAHTGAPEEAQHQRGRRNETTSSLHLEDLRLSTSHSRDSLNVPHVQPHPPIATSRDSLNHPVFTQPSAAHDPGYPTSPTLQDLGGSNSNFGTTSRFYQRPLTAEPQAEAGHLPSYQTSHYQYAQSLPRDTLPQPPGAYPTMSTSMPRNGFSSLPSLPPAPYMGSSPEPSKGTVVCPSCARPVVGNKINEHLDTKCSMYLVELTSGPAGPTMRQYDEYDPERQYQSRLDASHQQPGHQAEDDEYVRARLAGMGS